jgi:UDP-2-acetamido-2-deoxy-ribo-hexuluronate aminotransferase
MEFIDLHMQQERIRDKIEVNIKRVLDHGKYIMGPEIEELEKKLADYVGVRYAVGVASGTDALLMALMTHNIGPGDAVFTSPFTFIATAEVIQLLGARPVFVDIQPDTFNIDPEKLEPAIRKIAEESKLNAKAVIPVDLFGQPADYDEINVVAKKYNLFVLQDAAQSFGASYRGTRACSHGDIAATSFFPAKPLGCYGDGGMVFTDNPGFYDKLISIRVHGKGADKYDNIRVGINGRLDTIQAAVLLAKLEIFEEEIRLRQEVARRYGDGLKNAVTVPFIKEHNISSWAQYSVLHPRRGELIAELKKQGIPTAIYYPIPLHLQEAFSHLGYKKGDFPVSEKAAAEIFSIPMHPYLGKEDQQRIIDIIAKKAVRQ